jgi:hypothetical protein
LFSAELFFEVFIKKLVLSVIGNYLGGALAGKKRHLFVSDATAKVVAVQNSQQHTPSD